MQHLEQVKNILVEVLSLDKGKIALREDSILLGSIPELDSLTVVNVIAALEENFGITIDDDEISAKNFATLGSLAHFIEQKLAEQKNVQ